MLENFPVAEALKKVFTASGECSDINWSFLGITMPGWCLIFFIALGAGALWAGFKRRV
jgi:disulfide bond formation protein DsbB